MALGRPSAVSVVPNGAHPSYAHGYYGRDNAFCKAWDGISKDRESFTAWMKQHVMGTKDHAEFMQSAGITPPRERKLANA